MTGVNQITAQFRTQYSDEFKLDYEVDQAQLLRCVHSNGLIKGEQVKFDIVGVGEEAVKKGRDGKIPTLQLGLSQVAAVLDQDHAKYRIDNFDAFRANPNTRTVMNVRGKNAINRKINQVIIDQLDTATNVQNSGAAAAASSLAVISGILKSLMDRDVPIGDMDTWGLITPSMFLQMCRITEFKSSDYVSDAGIISKGPPGAGSKYEVRRWMGVNWMVVPQLTGKGTASAKCYVAHKSALGHLFGGEPSPILFQNDEDAYSGVRFEVTHAAKMCLQSGVQQYLHDDTAAFA